MKFIYHDKANNGGIYKITNLHNGRIYIGSTVRFKNRAKSHLDSLTSGQHSNRFLQNDWNKCGAEAFLLEVVEVVVGDKTERLAREQFFIDQFYDRQRNCYNLTPQAISNREGTKNVNPPGTVHLPPQSPEVKAKRIASIVEAYQDPVLRDRSRQFAMKRWDLHSANIAVTNRTTNESIVIDGSIREFCLSRGLSYKAFHQMVQGKIKTSGGWFLGTVPPAFAIRKGEKRGPMSVEHRNKIAASKFLGEKLINDSGDVLCVEANVKEQCRRLGLHYTTFLKVLRGVCGSIGGYRRLTDSSPDIEKSQANT